MDKFSIAFAARPFGRVLAIATVGALLASCGAVGGRKAVPLALQDSAQVVGMQSETIRFWGDELPPNAASYRSKRVAQLTRSRSDLRGGRRPIMNSLALSGGGPLGAYGAGVLAG